MTALLDLIQSQPTPFIAFGVVVLIIIALGFETERVAKARETRAELTAATIAHIGTCGHSNGALVCGRAKDHAEPWHADWSKDTERPIKWRDGSLGLRSLDEIRREWDGGAA